MKQISIGTPASVLALVLGGSAVLHSGIAGAQNITTVAGNGTGGYSGDGGQATAAMLANPISVAVDAAGNRYVLDYSSRRIRRVDAAGVISTYVGTGAYGDSGDGGPATAATFRDVYDIAVDTAGNLYFADYGSHRIRRVGTNGIVTTIAGTGAPGYSGDGGPATAAAISYPVGVTVDAQGAVYFTDYQNCRVRKISAGGIMSTIAGTTCGYSGDGGPATVAQISNSVGIDVDAGGNVYISEYAYGNRVRRISATGTISTVAGTGAAASSGDGGPAATASLNVPWDVEVDAGGNLYISEFGGHRIRRVSTTGTIATFAGTGVPGYNGDNQLATSAQLNTPAGLAVANGSVYVAEFGGHRVRRISLFSTCAASGLTGSKLTLCKQVCEVSQPSSLLTVWLRMYVSTYREDPPCAL